MKFMPIIFVFIILLSITAVSAQSTLDKCEYDERLRESVCTSTNSQGQTCAYVAGSTPCIPGAQTLIVPPLTQDDPLLAASSTTPKSPVSKTSTVKTTTEEEIEAHCRYDASLSTDVCKFVNSKNQKCYYYYDKGSESSLCTLKNFSESDLEVYVLSDSGSVPFKGGYALFGELASDDPLALSAGLSEKKLDFSSYDVYNPISKVGEQIAKFFSWAFSWA